MPTPRFNDDPAGDGGHWSTKDITVAALVASFGFRWRGRAPIMHIVHANRLVSAIDRNTGKIEDAHAVGYFFDYQTTDSIHGRITCSTIEACYRKREIDLLIEAGEHVSGSRIEKLNRLLKNSGATEQLAREVCRMADAMENILLIAAGVHELATDPMIQVAKSLRKGKLDILRPMETEPVAQRFLERIARNA